MITNPTLEDFETKSFISKGHAGRVYLAAEKNTNQLYAVKILEMPSDSSKLDRIYTEKEILEKINNPFIISAKYCFQTNNQFFFVMPYCSGGEFRNIISKQPQKCLDENSVKFYSAEVLVALECLHLNGYVHRDIKTENILMKDNGHVVLADFDLSIRTDIPKVTIVKKSSGIFKKSNKNICCEPKIETTGIIGTPDYLAPEIIEEKTYGSEVDWWEFGVLMYEMLYGIMPFRGKNFTELFESIKKSKIIFPIHPKCNVSKEIKNIITNLTKKSPKKRLGHYSGASEIKQHDFYKDTEWNNLQNKIPPIKPMC